MLRIILSVFLIQVIASTPTPTPTNLTDSSITVINSVRNKTLRHLSPSPITFIQKMEPVHLPRNSRPTRNKLSKLSRPKQAQKKSFVTHDFLNSLGIGKLPTHNNNHRKRLATQSRHVGRPDDSNVFIIKLPPNPNYYSQTTSFKGANELNSIDDKSKKIPVGFKSNGKPGRIYHWNIPVLKKIIGGGDSRGNSKKYKEKKANLRHTDLDVEDLLDIQNTPTWSIPSDLTPAVLWRENDTLDKSEPIKFEGFSTDGIDDDERAKILKKKSSPAFYAPVKKQNIHKYFPSNGKPKSFYVIEKNKQPISYQNLIE